MSADLRTHPLLAAGLHGDRLRGVRGGPWDRTEMPADTGTRHRSAVRGGAVETVLPPGARWTVSGGGLLVTHASGAQTALVPASGRWVVTARALADQASSEGVGRVSAVPGFYGPEVIVASTAEVMVARGVDGPGWTLEAVTVAGWIDDALDAEVLSLMHYAVLG